MNEKLEYRRSSLRDFLHVLFKRKKHILFFFVFVNMAVIAFTLLSKPAYEAKALLLVKIGRENIYIPPNTTKGQVINFSREDQVNSEIELLKSRSLAEKVINMLGAENIYKSKEYKDTVLKFQESLTVGRIKKADVIEVSYKHSDPEKAALIVNTLAKAYLDEHLHVHKTSQSYSFFEGQSQVLKTKLEKAEKELELFKRKNVVTVLDEQQKLLLRQISDLHSEFNITLSKEAETKNRILQISRQLRNTPETILQGEEVNHNPYIISNLEARLVELRLQETDLLTKYTPQNRLVINIREEIQIVQNKLTEQEKKRYGRTTVGLNTIYQQLQEELFRNQAEAKALAAKKEIQNTQLVEYRKKLEQLNQVEVKLNQLKEAVDVNRQNYRLYLAKFEESRISDAMDKNKITNVTLMDAALPPLEPGSPKLILNVLLAILLGGFGGIGLGFFTEYLDDSLENPEDVERELQLPVLASFPKLKQRN